MGCLGSVLLALLIAAITSVSHLRLRTPSWFCDGLTGDHVMELRRIGEQDSWRIDSSFQTVIGKIHELLPVSSCLKGVGIMGEENECKQTEVAGRRLVMTPM